MTGFVSWSDSGHRARAEELAGGAEQFEAAAREMLAEARAWRLVEMRRERGCTQTEIAQRMGVSKGRISQIENGRVSGSEVVARYVRALGGNLVTVAVFEDGELRKIS